MNVMRHILPKLILAISFVFFVTAFPGIFSNVYAQDQITGVAIPAPISGNTVQDGQLICSNAQGYDLCNIEYATTIYGVVSLTPAVQLATQVQGYYPVVSHGLTRVNVTSKNGNIKAGDFITTSTSSGVGEKATRNGYVLGIALEDFTPAAGSDTGKILVSVDPRATLEISDTKQNLLQIIREGLSSAVLTPLATIRYLFAGLAVILSLVIGFIYFGRVAKAGVEAIGRNPLSSRTIQAGVILHIGLTIVIVVIGLGIAYLILTL